MTEIKNAVNGAGEPPVDHLAAIGGMSPAEYARQRQAISEATGIPFKFLDRNMTARRRAG